MKNLLMLSMVFLACGTSPTVNVRLRAADNQPQGNPFATVLSDFNSGLSRGLYFQLYEMTSCPQNIVDLASQSPALSQPNENETGASPAAASFTIDISRLQKNKAYQLKVLAVSTGSVPQITHEGIADCPVYASDAGKQAVTLCFANRGVTPQCSTATPFDTCRKPAGC